MMPNPLIENGEMPPAICHEQREQIAANPASGLANSTDPHLPRSSGNPPDTTLIPNETRPPREAAIPASVWAEYRPWLESPKAVAAELGITTAECLARARGETVPHDFTLHLVREGPVLWIYRPHKRAAALRSGGQS